MADGRTCDIFLELVGPSGPVAGGSTDDQYSGQIELDSFSFTVVPVPRRAVKATPKTIGAPPRTPDKTIIKTSKDAKTDDHEDKQVKKRKDDSITIVKHLDKASPVLLQSFCKFLSPTASGQQSALFQKAAVTFRISRGGAPLKLLVLILTGVAVIDYQFQPVEKGSTHPSEKVSLSYKTLEIQYRPEPNASRISSMRSVTFDKTQRQVQ